MSNKAKRWMSRVAQLPCCICGVYGVHVHHIKEGTGASQRAADTLVLPLCELHHTGSEGIHGLGRKGFYMRYKKSELDYLAETIEALA